MQSIRAAGDPDRNPKTIPEYSRQIAGELSYPFRQVIQITRMQ